VLLLIIRLIRGRGHWGRGRWGGGRWGSGWANGWNRRWR
jgi:hypothetical protein